MKLFARKKRIILITAAIVFVIAAAVLYASCGGRSVERSAVSAYEWETDSLPGETAGKQIVLENGNFRFVLDAETGHFSVTDKMTAKDFLSSRFMDDTAGETASELIITYYDQNSTAAYMDSEEYSVNRGGLSVSSDGRTARVSYRISKSGKNTFVPAVISQPTMEEEIFEKLGAGEVRRLKRFYRLYETGSEDSRDIEADHPAIGEGSLYVLSDDVQTYLMEELADYFSEAGYTREKYAEEAERLGIVTNDGSNLPAAFVIPVEYSLSEDGFSARVMTGEIVSESSAYTLTNISLLPYFCAFNGSNGWILVPDGSGAVIETDEKPDAVYSQAIYGTDPAIHSASSQTVMQTAFLPGFGMSDTEKGFYTFISEGSSVARVTAEVNGSEHKYSRVFADFSVTAFDTSDIASRSAKAVFNVYDSAYTDSPMTAEYILFGNTGVTYSEMAGALRDHLLASGLLKENGAEDTSMLIDFTGYETIDESFLGIPVKKKVTYSTLDGISAFLKESEEKLKGVDVRLLDYGNGGVDHQFMNGFDLNGSVGSEEELMQLSDMLQACGGRLWLDDPVESVYTGGNGFQRMKHSVRDLKKKVFTAGNYDLVARDERVMTDEHYLVSPVYYKGLIKNFTDDICKAGIDIKELGFSWRGLGSVLYGDYNEESRVDRETALRMRSSCASELAQKYGALMTDGGAVCLLGSCSLIADMPLCSSDLNSESYSVPFFQMTVRGCVTYAGTAVNSSADGRRTFLNSIESGAILHYSFITEELSGSETGSGKKAAGLGRAGEWSSEIGNVLEEWKQAIGALSGQAITGHERITEGVFCTTFEDGTRVYVNYTGSDYSGEVDVPALGYTVG